MNKKCIAILLLMELSAVCSPSQIHRPDERAWNQPLKPFHIIGNIYYVGPAGVSSFLIATPEGLILIDGGFRETAPEIETSVTALGFHMRDVKILLNTHAHFDHSGGLDTLKRASGAKLIASAGDREALQTGREPYQAFQGGGGDYHADPVSVDRVIADGETVKLGATALTAHIMPGHTKGCTTWTMPVTGNGKTYQVVFYCSTSVAGNRLFGNREYPDIVADYHRSFVVAKQLPCDVFLAPHAGFFHLQEKLAKVTANGPNPFVDPSEYPAFVAQSEQDFETELKRQQGQK